MSAEMHGEEVSSDVRDGVRQGIIASIKMDTEHRGGRTARLILAAGVIGVLGAIGAILLVARHPFDHHPSWHLAVFGAVWSGLLIVNLVVMLLEVRTPTLPLARASAIGILGLGMAGLCGAACPDQHFLRWWFGTAVGASVSESGGAAAGAMCFGLVATLFVGMVAATLAARRPGHARERSWLPAAALVGLLLPGVALQSVGTSVGIFLAWVAGTAVGAWGGVAIGMRAHDAFAALRRS